jgi:hypothetical protein
VQAAAAAGWGAGSAASSGTSMSNVTCQMAWRRKNEMDDCNSMTRSFERRIERPLASRYAYVGGALAMLCENVNNDVCNVG